MENEEKIIYDVKLKVVKTIPLIRRRGRSSLYPTSVKIIDALNELEYNKILRIDNYRSAYSLRSCLVNWIDRGYIKNEYMLRIRGKVIYIWKVKDYETKVENGM